LICTVRNTTASIHISFHVHAEGIAADAICIGRKAQLAVGVGGAASWGRKTGRGEGQAETEKARGGIDLNYYIN
jgi:hypothetical protein